MISAIDPANPYGSLLPWPEPTNPDAAKPRRVAGATVFLLDGRPVLYAARRGRQLTTFPAPRGDTDELLRVVVPCLRRLPRRSGKRRILIEEIDGARIEESGRLDLMRECGFERSYRGLVDVKV